MQSVSAGRQTASSGGVVQIQTPVSSHRLQRPGIQRSRRLVGVRVKRIIVSIDVLCDCCTVWLLYCMVAVLHGYCTVWLLYRNCCTVVLTSRTVTSHSNDTSFFPSAGTMTGLSDVSVNVVGGFQQNDTKVFCPAINPCLEYSTCSRYVCTVSCRLPIHSTQKLQFLFHANAAPCLAVKVDVLRRADMHTSDDCAHYDKVQRIPRDEPAAHQHHDCRPYRGG